IPPFIDPPRPHPDPHSFPTRRSSDLNWLLFGERSAAHDNFHAEEFQAWLSQGVLQRVDHAWSRDGAMPRYVQDAVSAQAATIAADRKSTRLNSSHVEISYAVFCLNKK